MPVRRHIEQTRLLAGKLKLPPRHAFLLATIDPSAFMLLLGKIAHGFAVVKFGIDSFRHRLPPLLLNKTTTDTLPYLIGGDERRLASSNHLHEIGYGIVEIRGVIYHLVTVRLFAFLGYPSYTVVVGEDLTNKARFPEDGIYRGNV